MAEDFHALSQVSTRLTAMPEDQLASIEGGGKKYKNGKNGGGCNQCCNGGNTNTNTNRITVEVNPTIQVNVGPAV